MPVADDPTEIAATRASVFAVAPDDGVPRLLDANVKIDHVAIEGSTLEVKLAHRGAFELRLNRRPLALRVDGQAAPLACVPAGAGYAVEGSGQTVELVLA